MIPWHLILHPTDFSTHSDYAFRLACSLARDHGARVIAVHVMRHPIAYGEVGAYAAEENERPALLADLERLQAPDDYPPIEHRLVEGDPAGEIVQLAEETQCDLIVMGTHGRRGLSRLVMGSVAENVIRHAPCPVLTVKASVPAASPLLAELAQHEAGV
jgi:nucleotide-binding universal stress UspA family protein